MLLVTLCVAQLFQEDEDLEISEDPVYPFIYHEHDIHSIRMLKEVLSEKGHVFLIIPTEPALEISLQASRFAEQYEVIMYTKDMRRFVEQSHAENCFFHGKVHRQKSSFAVIDACQAPRLKGYISYNDKVYLLEPEDEEEDGNGHVIRIQTPQSSLRSLFSSDAVVSPDNEDVAPESQTRLRRQLQGESRPLFLELYVVCDFALYEHFDRDADVVREKVRMVIEVLKELYLDLGIHVFLSGIEIWNEGDPINPINSGLRTMFDDFLIWRKEDLLPGTPHDFAMIISGKGYSLQSSSSPIVFKMQMCSPWYSGLAIKEVNLDDPVLPALLARHIGFGMGFSRDDASSCNCEELSGCIMEDTYRWSRSPPTKFSSCSKQMLSTAVARGRLSCLLNQPDGFEFPSRCGDGNLDEGEECDCGSEKSCTDECCDPLTCIQHHDSPACKPTTELSPTMQSHLLTSSPESLTTSSAEFETRYIEDIITELETEGYLFTTLMDEEAQVTTPAYSTASRPAASEVPLTENEKLIRWIKEMLGDENIQEPPSFIQEPGEDPIYFTEETNVTLPCRVSGLPTPSIVWYKDDDQLDLLQGQKWTVEEDGSLHITGVDETDEGGYHCEANNTHGIIISNKAHLSRAYLGELPFSGLEIYLLEERQSLVLRCQSPKSSPNPTFYWTKDLRSREPVILSDRVSQTPLGDLVIGSALPEDSGDYSCVITNRLLDKVLVAAAITVNVKALVHKPLWNYTSPSEVTGLRGKSLSLHCIPTGSPTPKVTWEKLGSNGKLEGIELSEGDRTMTILEPDVPDGGEYVCRASNGVGKDIEAVFSVTVDASPEWTSKPENVEIPAGTTHSFICEASGVPTPSISWLVNGQEAEQAVVKYPHLSFRSGLASGVFNITDNEDSYLTVVVQCIAANQHGRIMANAYVNIIVFPARIITPPPESVISMEGEDIKIPCQALGAPKPHLFWQVGVKMLTPEEDGSLLIPAVGVGDTNSYFCRVRNKYGFEDKKVAVKVRGLTQVALSTHNISAEEESEVFLTCQVDHHADVPPDIQWSRNDGMPLDANRTVIEVNSEISMSSLIIENLVLEDSGVYVCTATTDYDEATDQVYITVTEKLVIQPPAAPGNITMILGQLHYGLLIMWEQEYSEVAPVSTFLVQARNSYYPDTWEVVKAVAGEEDSAVVKVNPYVTYWFRIIAKNEVGEAVGQRTGPLLMPASTPLKNPQNVAVDASDPTKIRVSWDQMDLLDHAGPKFFYRVKWRGLGTKRWKDVKIRDHTVTEYVFEMDSSDISGVEVAVKSGNSVGNGPKAIFVTSLFVLPTTVAPLTFSEVPPEFAVVLEGSRFKLNCSATGGMNPETFWSKNGILLARDNGNYTIDEEGGLLFPGFTESDVGVYDCTIRSSTGESIEARSSLSIRRKTRVLVNPSEVEVTEFSSLEVTCDVELDESIFSADILWVDPQNQSVPYYFNVVADERVYRNYSVLVIEEVRHSDAGTYICIAETRQDYAEGSVTITVLDIQPPQVSPQQLVVQIQDSRTVTASWGEISAAEAGGPVVGYHVVARVRGDVEGETSECFTTVTTCLLEDLAPSETYEVFVAVRTTAGQGPYSPAEYVTLPDPEPVPPGPVSITKIRVWAKTLTVRWKAPEDGDPLYGYILSHVPAEGSQDIKERTLSPAMTVHKISSLTPGTQYNISIEAYNRAGRGQKVTRMVTTRQKSG